MHVLSPKSSITIYNTHSYGLQELTPYASTLMVGVHIDTTFAHAIFQTSCLYLSKGVATYIVTLTPQDYFVPSMLEVQSTQSVLSWAKQNVDRPFIRERNRTARHAHKPCYYRVITSPVVLKENQEQEGVEKINPLELSFLALNSRKLQNFTFLAGDGFYRALVGTRYVGFVVGESIGACRVNGHKTMENVTYRDSASLPSDLVLILSFSASGTQQNQIRDLVSQVYGVVSNSNISSNTSMTIANSLSSVLKANIVANPKIAHLHSKIELSTPTTAQRSLQILSVFSSLLLATQEHISFLGITNSSIDSIHKHFRSLKTKLNGDSPKAFNKHDIGYMSGAMVELASQALVEPFWRVIDPGSSLKNALGKLYGK